MGSTYNIYGGNQAAVGDNAQASNIEQHSTSVSSPPSIDLQLLATELAEFRKKLGDRAETSDHYKALAELSEAQEAANKGDRKTALESIKRAGNWIWEIAKEVGVGVTVEAAKSAIGL